MSDGDAITCEIDLETGKVKITAPPEHFAPAAKAVEGIIALRKRAAEAPAPKPTATTEAPPSEDPPRVLKERGPGRPAKTGGGSSARSGRIGSFEPVAFNLTEAQERELHDFYRAKNPRSQPDKVACAMYKAEQVLNRRGMSYNEIYTVLRLSGERVLPKALDVLIARMIEDNWIARDAEGFTLKFLARDHVEQKLPAGEA